MNLNSLDADRCLKCNICTAACPVAAVTDKFLGPKAVGPQSDRFHHPRLKFPHNMEAWCSSCGICSVVCPHGVPVAEIILRKKDGASKTLSISLRDQFISRPERLGRLGSRIAPVANRVLGYSRFRSALDNALGISHHAPLPSLAGGSLRKRLRDYCVRTPMQLEEITRLTVAYFHGCSTNFFEPGLGELAIAVLEKLGLYVFLPPQVCCGLPLQSNGNFEAAKKLARKNIQRLLPFAKAKIPIVGTSPSCMLALKHDYREILGLDDEDAELIATSSYDYFEFLTFFVEDDVERIKHGAVHARALYHPPCQLRSHGIGTPALPILRRIPRLTLEVSHSACCGVAGTYGLKSERYEVARSVGQRLFNEALVMNVDFIITDSETCRWWISKHTNLPALHPLEVLARSMGIR